MRFPARLRPVALLVMLAVSVAAAAPVSANEAAGGGCCASGSCDMVAPAMQCCAPVPVVPTSSSTPAVQAAKVTKPESQPIALPVSPPPSPGTLTGELRAAFDLERLRQPHAPPYLLNVVFRI